MPIDGLDPNSYNGTVQNPYTTVWQGNYANGSEGTGAHPGVDIGATGYVVAIADGTVVYLRRTGVQRCGTTSGGWGAFVVIRHADGTFSIYAHLESDSIPTAVQLNQSVTAGQRLGRVGNTGNACPQGGGIHLHLQIDRDLGGTHPYWCGDPDDVDNATCVEQRTINPIPYIRSHSNQRPSGFLDGINSLNQVFGWAKDLDSPDAAVTVHLYIDKNAGAPGAMPIALIANQFRSDVGNHAFNWDISANLKDGQTHTVWAWGIDLTDPISNNALLAGSPKTFNIPSATQPPTAGFLMVSGNQSATDGQTLNVMVPPGDSAPVSVSAGASHANFPGGSITGWAWSIDGMQFSTAPSFGKAFAKGTYQISLVVTDNLGSKSVPASGTVAVTESGPISTGSMNEGRTEFTATALNNGTVLAAGGGTGGAPIALSTAEIYNPNTKTWHYTLPMSQARVLATATKLKGGVQEGKVLIVGGIGTSPGPADPSPPSAEIFDPATERFTPTPPLNQGHAAHAAVMLQDGRVFIVSGDLTTGTCEIYDPVLNSWQQKAPLPLGRIHHAAVLLLTGNVLVSGGSSNGGSPTDVYLYNLATDSWRSMTPLLLPRSGHTMTLLPDGRVLIVGALQNSTLPEIYDPTAGINGQTQFGNPLADDRTNGGHTAISLPNGDVVIAGGQGVGTFVKSIQVFQHLSLTWSPVQQMTTSRERHAAVLLQNGQILFAGGVNESGLLKTAELWQQ